ncbi:Piso0_000166 [Millerozyma farinosa CBS 7064]|uniref:Cargo-transport protein YPP1 n=1 Tax=Pichia sorbitophila (strain ATCC MYA-4447 / BCRC 22081 / CBS 7064 / NBRC 10061 / NRRL Y-12695) TaxID=559304 RepID=G8YUP7_PICSO|nr:Piso0_000166 [Millerozyma farinosa CBS 7064]
MKIENADDNKYNEYFTVLSLGCFPRDVAQFKGSSNIVEQTMYVDYHIETVLLESSKGDNLTFKEFRDGASELHIQKVGELAEYMDTIETQNEELEVDMYAAVVRAHVFYLLGKDTQASEALKGVGAAEELSLQKQGAFFKYLQGRYFVLKGLCDAGNAYEIWKNSITKIRLPLNKSEIAAQRWREILYKEVALLLLQRGNKDSLSFHEDVEKIGLFQNAGTLVSFSLFALQSRACVPVDSKFKHELSEYLSKECRSIIKQQDKFPDAEEENSHLNEFLFRLHEPLILLKDRNTIIKPDLHKELVIHVIKNTYQSRVALKSLIDILIENGEFDEALAAFKTYTAYVEKDMEQHEDTIDDILLIVEAFSTCVTKFNPINIGSLHESFSFKHFDPSTISDFLDKYSEKLEFFLTSLSETCQISYQLPEETPLSFLYHLYNPELKFCFNAGLKREIGRGWYALARYAKYKTIFRSYTESSMLQGVSNLMRLLKNSLIVTQASDEKMLFDYALTLAYNLQFEETLKLCRFILKRFSESFKTWNLLVLVASGLEVKGSRSVDHPKSANPGEANGSQSKSEQSESKESLKYINSALNIAGIYIANCQKSGASIPTTVKYDILQLKMTQVAVLESMSDSRSVVDMIPEVFMLYNELFETSELEIIESNQSEKKLPNGKTHDASSNVSLKSGKKSTIFEGNGKALSRRASRLMDRRHHKHANQKSNNVVKKDDGRSLITKKILSEVWLWTSKIYMKNGSFEDAEQCIVEAESTHQPNASTANCLGLLTSQKRKSLALEEFQRTLDEVENSASMYKKREMRESLLGISKLVLGDDEDAQQLFTSDKDKHAGLVRLKNYLESFVNCWPYGYNYSELWWYLSLVYEKIDDKNLLSKSLWKCVELEDARPIRSFDCCEGIGC